MSMLTMLSRLQGDFTMVNREQLLANANARGAGLSDRQLTSLITYKVFPQSVRWESEGQWPAVAADLLAFIGQQRRNNLPMYALRQLAPVWVFLEGCVRTKQHFDVEEFEAVVVDRVRDPLALMVVPWMVGDTVLRCPDMEVTAQGKNVQEITLVLTMLGVDARPTSVTIPMRHRSLPEYSIRVEGEPR